MKDNWGRWGDGDEAGAVNLIGAGETVRAAAQVTRGEVISLAQPISTAMAVPKHRPGVMHFMGRDGGDYAAGQSRKGGFQFSDDTVVLPTHSGTHLDALCHCWYDDALYKVPVAGPVRGRVQQFLAVPAGAETCGPVIHDREGSVFVAVQHPGEDGSWAAPQSRFPDYVPVGSAAGAGAFAGPRPAVIQVRRA